MMPFNHCGTQNLESEHLVLRRFEYSDAAGMLKNWIANPVIQHNYGEPVYDTFDSVRELLQSWISQYHDSSFYRWTIILKETGENIGQIAFCRVYTELRTAEVEYCIGESFRGNGYAAEALKCLLKYSFEMPEFDKIEAFHRAENPTSGRVLQKAGMNRVANVTRHEINNEEPSGHICHAMKREEYLAQKYKHSQEGL